MPNYVQILLASHVAEVEEDPLPPAASRPHGRIV